MFSFKEIIKELFACLLFACLIAELMLIYIIFN